MTSQAEMMSGRPICFSHSKLMHTRENNFLAFCVSVSDAIIKLLREVTLLTEFNSIPLGSVFVSAPPVKKPSFGLLEKESRRRGAQIVFL